MSAKGFWGLGFWGFGFRVEQRKRQNFNIDRGNAGPKTLTNTTTLDYDVAVRTPTK